MQQNFSYCNRCGRKIIGFPTEFCRADLFSKYGNKQQSKNGDINAFIKKTKVVSVNCDDFVEWIPISDIENINSLEQSGYSKICSGVWKPFKSRNKSIDEQEMPSLNVILKVLKSSQNFDNKFLN